MGDYATTTLGRPTVSAMLMDPRTNKNHLANGTPSFTTHSDSEAVPGENANECNMIDCQATALTADLPLPLSDGNAHNHIAGQARSPQTNFDPSPLLNPTKPKQTLHKQYQKAVRSDTPDEAGVSDPLEDQEGQGVGGFIERMHGITHREERPRKRRKTKIRPDEDDEEGKPTFHGGGRGTEIGDYLREKSKESQANVVSDGAVIDLTAGKQPQSDLLLLG